MSSPIELCLLVENLEERYYHVYHLIFAIIKNFLEDFDEAISRVKKSGYNIKELPRFKDNIYVVKTAVSNIGYALKYAGPDARNHPDVVKAAVSNIGYALEYAGPDARNHPEVAKAAVSNIGYALEYVSKELQNDKEVVLASVKNNRYSIKYASSELQKDRDVLNCCADRRPNGTGNSL